MFERTKRFLLNTALHGPRVRHLGVMTYMQTARNPAARKFKYGTSQLQISTLMVNTIIYMPYTDGRYFYLFCVMLFLQGKTFVKELDHVLGIADEAQQSKTLKQFQEWDKNVHGAIQVLGC